MSKTAAFTGLSSLRDLLADSLAIDMGSASTIIWVKGRGVVVDQPSLVATSVLSGEIIAVGHEAERMLGREAREVTVIAPLIGGVVADFERTREMLDHFVRQARSGATSFSRRALIGVVSGITTVEQRALLAVAEQAKIGRVGMIEEGLAAAIGAGVKVEDERASLVVDIGAGTTNVAAVVGGTIVHARAERIGGSDINAAIMDHMRRHRGLSIGAQTAERLKIALASATPPADLSHEVTVKGRDVQTGGPGAVEITAGEIYPVAEFVVRKIGDLIQQTLSEFSPEVAADIYDRGIILTGGGAQFSGLEDYLRTRTHLAVACADEPRYAVVRGLAQMFDEPLTLRRLLRGVPSPLLEAEAGTAEA